MESGTRRQKVRVVSTSDGLKVRFEPTSDGDRDVKRKGCVLDFDTLDCPICMEPLAAPVYQCHNGHTACGGCCKKLTTGLCPSCSLPIGTNRCIAVEKIVESLRVQCKYATFGCKNMMQYSKRKIRHEGVCKFRQYLCPAVGCDLEVSKSDLLDHFVKNHKCRILHYQKPDDRLLRDEVKDSFTLSINKNAYDSDLNQYVILQVSGNQDSEDQDPDQDQDCGERDSEDQLFLVHFHFNQCTFKHSLFLTSFGTCYSFDYSLSVTVERGGHSLVGKSRSTVKYNYSIRGPVCDNQTDVEDLLSEVVRIGDCLSIPRLQGDSSKLEVEFQIVARRHL